MKKVFGLYSKKTASDLLIITGMCIGICGLYQIYEPLAWLAAGGWLCGSGAIVGTIERKKREANQS